MDGLIDRYLAAVGARVPAPRRAQVQQQVRGLLQRTVEADVAAGVPREQAEQAAVAGLGDPVLLAQRYGGRPAHLIGPDYFPAYWRLLRTLLAIVVPVIASLVVLAEAVGGGSAWQMVLAGADAAFTVAVQLAFWVTVVFAVMERTGTRAPGPWSPSDLPRESDRRIGLGETVAAVCLQAAVIVLLLWQRDNWLVDTAEGLRVPFVDPALWDAWMPALIAVLAASILLEAAKYRTGRWTVPLAAANTVLNLAFAAVALAVVGTGDLINPAIDAPEGTQIGLRALAGLLVVVTVWDTAGGWWRALRR